MHTQNIDTWPFGWPTTLVSSFRLLPIQITEFEIGNILENRRVENRTTEIEQELHPVVADLAEELSDAGIDVAPDFWQAYLEFLESSLPSGPFVFEPPQALIQDHSKCLISIASGELGCGVFWAQVNGQSNEVFFSCNDLVSHCDTDAQQDTASTCIHVRQFPINPTAVVNYVRLGLGFREWMRFFCLEQQINRKLEKNLKLDPFETEYQEFVMSRLG